MPIVLLVPFALGILWYYFYMSTVAALIVRPDLERSRLMRALGPRVMEGGPLDRSERAAKVAALLVTFFALVSQAVAVLVLFHPSTLKDPVRSLAILAELLGAAAWSGYLLAALRHPASGSDE
jgi:hypothetical protein